MKQFTYNDVLEAYERIHDYVVETPLEKSIFLSDDDKEVFFKLECLQKCRSFKLRGCLNKMLSLTDEEKAKGVTTMSSGNHGVCVSMGAQMLGIGKTEIIVPETTPQSKIDKIEYYGGNVIKLGKNYDEAHALGLKMIEESSMTFVDSYDKDPVVYAGQGTIAVEILKQNPEIDTILVPIGGGGMLTGIAVAAKGINPNVRVIGVHTAACPALIKSYEDGVCYEALDNTEDSICDALVGGIGRLCYEMAKDYAADLVMVSEKSIRKAVAYMATQEKYIIEPASAVTLAALWEHGERIGGKKIALVCSGGNLDGDLLLELLEENKSN